jgi:uncharacterized protein YodC (DUF2158 family)
MLRRPNVAVKNIINDWLTAIFFASDGQGLTDGQAFSCDLRSTAREQENSMSAFQSGDVICLKSGGPDMTVESVNTDPTSGTLVTCIWFVDQTLYRTSLPVSVITAALWPVAA